MRRVLEEQDNLDIRQMEVTDIIADDPNESGIRKIKGVQTYSGAIYPCKAVILCTGTYLKARCIYGEISTQTGPNGLQSANYLTDSLKSLGIKMYRFKTGTPARIDKNSIDFTKMEEQKGDERVVPFLLRQIRKTFRSIKCHAGLHIQTKRRTKSFGKIWTDRRCFPVRLKEQDRDIVRR